MLYLASPLRAESGDEMAQQQSQVQAQFRFAHRIARRAWPKQRGAAWGPELALLDYLPYRVFSAANDAALGGKFIHSGHTCDPLNYGVRTRLCWRKAGCGVAL